MATKKLTRNERERMEAYANGYFYGRSGYELESLWASDEDCYEYVVEGFLAGHGDFCMFGDLDDFKEYDFDIPEDEDGKYVHI